ARRPDSRHDLLGRGGQPPRCDVSLPGKQGKARRNGGPKNNKLRRHADRPGTTNRARAMMRQAIAGQDGWSVAASPSSSSLNQSGDPVMSENAPASQRDLWMRVRARLKAAVGE